VLNFAVPAFELGRSYGNVRSGKRLEKSRNSFSKLHKNPDHYCSYCGNIVIKIAASVYVCHDGFLLTVFPSVLPQICFSCCWLCFQ